MPISEEMRKLVLRMKPEGWPEWSPDTVVLIAAIEKLEAETKNDLEIMAEQTVLIGKLIAERDELKARVNVAHQALTEIHENVKGSAGMMRIEQLSRMALFEVKPNANQ